MKGGRTAPRNMMHLAGEKPLPLASMKGGRTAPRNYSSLVGKKQPVKCFNEGGADCPPKPGELGTISYDDMLQ